MNVVHRGKQNNFKQNDKLKKGLIKKDAILGIRGSTLPIKTSHTANVMRPVNGPRYKFSKNNENQMRPPLEPPKTYKRKIPASKPISLDDRVRASRILANDSTHNDTSHELFTSKRPNGLRYISGSSRGGFNSTTSTSISVAEATVVLAISEGRGMARGEIGIAAVDLKSPQLILCQFSDTLLYTHTLTKINYFNPVEIIVPHTFCEGVQPNQLYKLIKDKFPMINLTTVQRRHFNDAAGSQQIKSLCAPAYSSVYLQVLQKFYALTAASAVLKYVEYIQCLVFARDSLKIEYHSSENTMIIDVGTATHLELVQPLVPSAGATCCLLGILGPTYTIGGIRALRAAILQPSCNREFIENRLDAVQELIESDSGLMIGLQDIIKKLSDVDKILLLCVESPQQNMDKMGEAQLNQTLLLKTTMDLVPSLIEALNVAECGRLRKIKIDFENPHYKEISSRIHHIIQSDAHIEKGAMGSLQRCFAVKPEINGLLDVARKTYSELIDDIQKIVEQLGETHDLPLRLNQNAMKGFHIVMCISSKNRRNFNVGDLPPIFIQVQNNGASVSMTTEELVVLDQQAKGTLNEIQKMSNIIISSLLKDLRPFMTSLYKLCENVAELDILLALAQASSVGSYIRPEFGNYMEIRNSVHPLLDYNTQVMPVPNDISATPEHNFTLITGPNMGGKSIYIKQIAIMQIMAQLGSFLPATSATLRICDRIFSRIGFNDSVELNASTYVLEMKEMQHILNAITPTSLVIIDELCRGTCAEEGTSVAWAICEELLQSDAFTFFTTHFIYLTRLQDLYFNVINIHTSVKEEISNTDSGERKKLVYEHKIDAGITKIEHYGLALAANTNLPCETINLARELAQLISKTRKSQQMNTPEQSEENLLYQLNAEIRKEIRKNENPDHNINQLITNFKAKNPVLIENLKTNNLFRAANTTVNNISEINFETTNNTTNSSNAPYIQYRPINKIPKVIDSTTTTDTSHDISKKIKSTSELLSTILNDSDVINETDFNNSKNKTSDNIYAIKDVSDDTKASKNFVERNFLINNTHTDFSDSDSELSEAFTNIVVDCDVHVYSESDKDSENNKVVEENTNTEDGDTRSCLSPSDHILMKETIDEINEHLGLSSGNILTPPMGFRDE